MGQSVDGMILIGIAETVPASSILIPDSMINSSFHDPHHGIPTGANPQKWQETPVNAARFYAILSLSFVVFELFLDMLVFDFVVFRQAG